MPRSWLKPRTARDMSATEAAWLAGFFDGEGSLSSYASGRDKRYRSWMLTIPNTCMKSLLRCREIAGCGSINPKPHEGNEKPIWHLVIHSQRDIYAVVTQLLPYLVTKREVVEKYLQGWSDIRCVG